MKIRRSTQFKAAFLTTVFLLNTLVGFACAVGVNMGFNSDHHQEDNGTFDSHHAHKHMEPHRHDKATSDHHSSKGSKDDCCKDEVARITNAEKVAQRNFDYSLLTISVFNLPVTTYPIGGLKRFPVNTPNAYFVRHCRAPVPDVRIAIQSFQI